MGVIVMGLNGQWIEIFRGGSQADSLGRRHNGDQLITEAVKTFNSSQHEPPLVVGHPADNAPAFGWVKGLREKVTDGVRILEAQLDQVIPEFEDAVKTGLFKKRSAAFYPDGRLRHVGFLGAVPPAVKGLVDIGFDDQGAEVFEFANVLSGDDNVSGQDIGFQNKTGGFLMEFKEFLEGFKEMIGLVGKPAEKVQDKIEGGEKDPVKTFTEADIEKAKQEAVADAEAQFAEKAKKETRMDELKARVDKLVKEGKVAPAFAEPFKSVILAADQVSEIEFGEGKKKNGADWMLEQIESRGASALFSELVRRDDAAFAEVTEDHKLGDMIASHVMPAKE
jgi:hypothetical protein